MLKNTLKILTLAFALVRFIYIRKGQIMKRDITEQQITDFELNEERKAEIAKALESGKKLKVTTKFELDKKVSVKANFVLAFTSNLRQLAELNISQNELKIITYILEVMEYGNLISISQAAIAKNTGVAKSNVSHNFKKLKDKKILIVDKDGNLLMNSALFQKGLSQTMTDERRAHLKNAQHLELNDNVEIVEKDLNGKKVKVKKEKKIEKELDEKQQQLPLRSFPLEQTL